MWDALPSVTGIRSRKREQDPLRNPHHPDYGNTWAQIDGYYPDAYKSIAEHKFDKHLNESKVWNPPRPPIINPYPPITIRKDPHTLKLTWS